MATIHVQPAYGRDYANKSKALLDWVAGKDFQVTDLIGGHCGQYLNNKDVPDDTIILRYGKQLKQMVLQERTTGNASTRVDQAGG